LGAAIVDLTLIAVQAIQRYRERASAPAVPTEDWKRVNTFRLILWVFFWATMILWVGSGLLHQPAGFVLLAIGLVVIFVCINGISNGISDSNPISSAFVVAVFLMATLGLQDPGTGLMCAAILLISCGVGVDMQQDRSTGWRLGTNRVIQFRYQVIGILMGAVMAVLLAKLFMQAYPVLKTDTFTHPDTPGAAQWQSAMTYKFVGALRGLTHPNRYLLSALVLGISLGLVTEILRKLMKKSSRYARFVRRNKVGAATDFILDAIILPSPYASSFGGFVDLATSAWFTLGGAISSVSQTLQARLWSSKKENDQDIPEDMSSTSLIGGGLIGGDSLAALAIGLVGLLGTLLR
jgi:uncharacterized oligopeptide transporter (OPT) family protein